MFKGFNSQFIWNLPLTSILSSVISRSTSTYDLIESKKPEDSAYPLIQLFDSHNENDILSNQSFDNLSRLNHPGIIQVQTILPSPLSGLQIRSDQKLISFWSEIRLKLTPFQKSTIILQLARAFEYLHARLIVHRNLNFKSLFYSLENNTILLSSFEYSRSITPSMSGGVPFSVFTAPEIVIPPGIYTEKVDGHLLQTSKWKYFFK